MTDELEHLRQQKISHLRNLAEDLEAGQHKTLNRKDVQELTGKVVNGILAGLVKKDKAAPLGVFIPLLWKMAKELEGTGTGGGMKIDITKQTMSIEMTDEMMDRYLKGDEGFKVEILEQLESEGKIKKQNTGSILEIEAKIEPRDVKTDPNTIAQITKGTDAPQTVQQTRRLFGRNMADTKHKSMEANSQEAGGFSDLFELPDKKALPDGALHKWKGKYEVDKPTGLGVLWFTCQQCQKKVRNCDQYQQELCEAEPGGQPISNVPGD